MVTKNPIYIAYSGMEVEMISGGPQDIRPGQCYFVKDKEGHMLGGITFQEGNPVERGVNGFTNEAILAIVKDRLKHLDAKFSCQENKLAIEMITGALEILEKRTTGRLIRGVEGKEVE